MNNRHRRAGLLLAATISTVISVISSGTAHAAVGVWYEIVNKNSGSCLDVRAEDNYYAPNARIQQYHCTGAEEQKWALVFHSNGYASLVSKRSGYCLQTGIPSNQYGAQIVQLPCGPDGNEQWLIVNAGIPNSNDFQGNWHFLYNGYPGFCLDVSGGSTADRAKIQQWPCNGTGAQEWILR